MARGHLLHHAHTVLSKTWRRGVPCISKQIQQPNIMAPLLILYGECYVTCGPPSLTYLGKQRHLWIATLISWGGVRVLHIAILSDTNLGEPVLLKDHHTSSAAPAPPLGRHVITAELPSSNVFDWLTNAMFAQSVKYTWNLCRAVIIGHPSLTTQQCYKF